MATFSSRFSAKDKGKGRADPSEASPLLPTTESASGEAASSSLGRRRSRSSLVSSSDRPPEPHSFKAHLITFVYVLCTLFIAAVLFLCLLASSLAPATGTREVQDAFVWRGPDDVRVLNVSRDGGIWVEVKGWVGVDADRVLGFSNVEDKDHKEEEDTGWWEAARRRFGRWGVDTIREANISFPSTSIFVFPASRSQGLDDAAPLLSLTPSPASFIIPLTSSLHASNPPIFSPHPNTKVPGWLHPLTMTFRVDLLASTEDLLEFVKRTWSHQRVDVGVVIETVRVSGVGRLGSLFGTALQGIRLDLAVPIPRIPHLPYPPPANLTDLVHLDSYRVMRSEPSNHPGHPSKLLLTAIASAPNFLAGIAGSFPFSALFSVGVILPQAAALSPSQLRSRSATDNEIALIYTLPVVLDPFAKRISVIVEGHVVLNQSPSSSDDNDDDETDDDSMEKSPLAIFVQSFLASDPLPLLLTHIPPSEQEAEQPPHVVPAPISHILGALDLAFPIPPPDPPIKLIRYITVEGMKISTSKDGKTILASGTVKAEVEVPESIVGKQSLGVNITRVKPDVLIYNGPVPNQSDASLSSSLAVSSSAHPLPFPLPPTVVGRLLPTHFIPSSTIPHPTLHRVFLVSAPFEHLPLEILRANQLSDFVSKILLRGGALAGVEGWCDVAVRVEGLGEGERELVVEGVKVEGQVWVGKQRLEDEEAEGA